MDEEGGSQNIRMFDGSPAEEGQSAQDMAYIE